MRKYLGIFFFSLLFLWGGVTLAVLGGNSLLGREDIPQALVVVQKDQNLKVVFFGDSYQFAKTLPIAQLSSQLLGGKIKLRFDLGRIDQHIESRNRWEARIKSRIFGFDGE